MAQEASYIPSQVWVVAYMKKLLPRVKSRLVVEDWVRRPPKTKEKGVGKAEVWADMVTLERRMLNAMAYMNAKGR